MIARVGLGLVAAVVLAWLVIMLRDARLAADGQEAFVHVRHPGAVARGERDYRRAQFLNPDTDPTLFRAFFAEGRGDWRRSLALALRVTREEPDNLRAWGGVLSAAQGRDPRRVAEARAAARRLNPLGG